MSKTCRGGSVCRVAARGSVVALLLVLASGACLQSGHDPDDTPGARLALNVAPLNLPGILENTAVGARSAQRGLFLELGGRVS